MIIELSLVSPSLITLFLGGTKLHTRNPQSISAIRSCCIPDIMNCLADYQKKLMESEKTNQIRLKEARRAQGMEPPLGWGRQQPPEKASQAQDHEPEQDEHEVLFIGSKKRSRIDLNKGSSPQRSHGKV